MRFFIEFTTINYKMRHALAIELNKLYPGSAFAGVDSSHGYVATAHLKGQSQIKYEFIDDFREVNHQALKEPPDHELLHQFELTLPEKSLWRLIAMDREWGWQFCRDVYLPRSYIQTINSQDNILRIFSGLLKYYQKVIRNFKPDVIIGANGQNSITTPIIDQLCINHKVLYLFSETIRTQNYMVITDNRQYTFPHVNETYQQLLNGTLNLDLSEGERIYNAITSDRENENYFNISRIDHFKAKNPWLKFLKASGRSIVANIVKWQKLAPIRKNPNLIFKQPDTLGTLLYNMKYSILVHFRRLQMMRRGFYAEFDPKEKYAYFPLHSSNEYSTLVQGTMWLNQLHLIEVLAKSLPHDWKLIVKEHPGILLWRVRPMWFYKEIQRYSNVKLVPTDMSTNMITSNAQIIVTIVGTTRWEAIMRDKPVIGLEENMFDCLELSRRCTDLKEFSTAIYEECERIKTISAQERKRRLICFMAAVAHHGVWVEVPGKVNGEIDCVNEQERAKISADIALSYKKFMQYRGLDVENKETAMQRS